MDQTKELRKLRLSLAIRERCKASGLTVTMMAQAIGRTRQAASLIYLGKSMPSLDTACRMADALGCSLDELVGRE